MTITYVPTEKELEHILYLRREIAYAERKLDEARETLKEYEKLIRQRAR